MCANDLLYKQAGIVESSAPVSTSNSRAFPPTVNVVNNFLYLLLADTL